VRKVRHRHDHASRVARRVEAGNLRSEDRLFEEKDAALACGAAQEMLGTLKDEVPAEVGQADEIDIAGRTRNSLGTER
jgi:hypothetical protein